ncbi:protein translocase subunit SecDF [Agrobacterium vitis]|uniref:protein translocase subunit SecDF n=1 Tax=Rhizobium/Agrobacterium group TaxID=227290 RepID=UPI0008DC083C|nr:MULTISPECIES: protein translocase subunit SecDF [Rhizobium/Agrobacterium group]MCF1434937.1 protein translocase subunit SecDF [Allorhizobium ampelinum]MUO91518.1 protein translocase subunit SecDF [Agrobacterium vitis]MUZ55057.1 protein translocase subunit SecDF [Agrobacterium vitis]MUZ94376.1 protein translocase subunit SecDF [Agrobacterium vitis]MVA42756.1 protein translocase subunit SecDF [Agrobacterium vitis]
MLHFSRWKTILLWLAVVASVLIALPDLFSKDQLARLPSWFPSKQMTLGLDLQGGSHIMLKIERNDIVKERLEAVVGDIRSSLRDAGVRYTGLNGVGQAVQVRITDPSQLDAARKALQTLTAPVSTGGFGSSSVQEATLDDSGDGVLKFNLTDAGIDYRMSSALTQSIEVVRRRVDELGNTEPLIQRQGSDRIIVQVPGLDDPQRLKNLLNQTAKLSFRMVDTSMSATEAISGRPPATSEVLYSQDEAAVPYLVEKRVLVSGEDLVDAQASFNQQNNEPVVSFRFDSRGAQRFAQATQQNVGRPFAIVLDNQVISAPVIREPIVGGSGQISGNFTVQGANDLAVLLRAGALPATLTVVEERTVGPSLGADSIRAGVSAGFIGAGLVVVLMIGLYGFFGVLAVLALFANIVMIIAILTLLGSTLTLPGIAGIVLTIGMAVDSNVLIYERIREEYKSGRSLIQSIDIGFNKALATIVDANVTTLIAAGVLFFLGSGPVRGFSVTLAIGIITTVFTAFGLTRWMFTVWVNTRRPKALPKGVRTGIFDGTNIPFMGVRRYTFLLSAALSIAALVGFGTVGMKLGIDFTGGSIIELKARQGNADPAAIREQLSSLNLGDVQVQGFGDPSSVLVRLQAQDEGENGEQSAVAKVRGALEQAYEFRRTEVVGPSVSGELTKSATIGVLISLMAILVYIWIRFEWQFAAGAIIATLHDVILTLGLYVVTGVEFDLSSIAAILTIVGYSLNDTVVVYDRMRENLRRYKKMPLDVLIDTSINQTLSRTILTSVTTLLALLALFLFGGEVIRSFTFAMLFGVLVGTFSSIYMAAPVLIAFRLRPEGQGEPDKAEKAKPEKNGATGKAGA